LFEGHGAGVNIGISAPPTELAALISHSGTSLSQYETRTTEVRCQQFVETGSDISAHYCATARGAS
jgi:hypothetical protein